MFDRHQTFQTFQHDCSSHNGKAGICAFLFGVQYVTPFQVLTEDSRALSSDLSPPLKVKKHIKILQKSLEF